MKPFGWCETGGNPAALALVRCGGPFLGLSSLPLTSASREGLEPKFGLAAGAWWGLVALCLHSGLEVMGVWSDERQQRAGSAPAECIALFGGHSLVF